jgi:indolepyruvate ferredoxin oxidoreductase alpha subunit
MTTTELERRRQGQIRGEAAATEQERPLLGDEAVAIGAIHAGISGAYSYPGTPATEILESVQRETRGGPPAREGGVQCVWSANEKVAYEEALGMSYAGRRALVSFKHVGLNVAADPFMNSAVTGIEGGMVVAVADDPGMHSSQNEQDSRVYSGFALIPCLEPATGQDAYEMTREAFDLSERLGLPVMLRLVTRLAHSRSGVLVGERRPPNPLAPTANPMDWVLLPSNARRRYELLLGKQEEILRWSESCRWNTLEGADRQARSGVIVSGIAYNYFREALGGDPMPPTLRLGAYPIPAGLVARLCDAVDEVLVIEEGYPVIEQALRGLLGSPRGKLVHGRLDGRVPRTGELNPDVLRAALGHAPLATQHPPAIELPVRLPCLCDGCPHLDTFAVIRDLLEPHPAARVFSDIGCYTLAAYPPHNACHSCVDMGASIGMASGAAQAGMRPVVATIGDSTFIHSGITPLVGAAHQDLPMTVFILDNSTVGMTGGQETMVNGEALATLVRALGVPAEHVHLLRAHRREHAANLEIVRRELAHEGLSVIIPVRECIQTAKR